MKIKCFSFFAVLIFVVLLTACGSKTNYMDIEGYNEYISDGNTGYDDVPFYNCNEAMIESIEAREYYSNNKRRCGDYLITNYEDGVCINKYFKPWFFELFPDHSITIPDELDGLPVVKIGGYPVEDENTGVNMVSAFGGLNEYTLIIPSTVKYIGSSCLWTCTGIGSEDGEDDNTLPGKIVVDSNNKYYTSVDGALYTKDKKTLLFDYRLNFYSTYQSANYDGTVYNVASFVENFEPSNYVTSDLSEIVFNKDIKKINTSFDMGEDGHSPDKDVHPDTIVKGYKNTVAESWAKEQYATFESLD